MTKKPDEFLSDEYTTVAVDQARKTIGCDLYRSWFPYDERVTLPFWRQLKSVELLGAVTDECGFFATEVTDRFIGDVRSDFFEPFKTNSSKTRISIYFPRASPDLNLVEEC